MKQVEVSWWQEAGRDWRIVLGDSHLEGWKTLCLEIWDNGQWVSPWRGDGYEWDMPERAVQRLASYLMAECRAMKQVVK